jgi:hypothetical protein
MSTTKHWAWDHFVTDGEKYQNNNSNKNAWCNACLVFEETLLRESDIIGVAMSGFPQARTEEQWQAQGDCYLFSKLPIW